ncbi:transcriptional attenuator, LytR family [Marinococcus luteus]|uniref:Transcriptional attenuator, LytR family n=1 Tax=Marinococcus luteus TaxID=1122204 RepID=A0A1H2TJA1_9BACI|nr:LCP family protein [Marinococcus luteus]SDW43857.1 transcriptional attenuator, LytR family [Marinococcus luteus]
MKKALLIIGGLFLALLIAVGIYAWYLYDSVADTAENINEGEDRQSNLREADVDLDTSEPISILLMGVDSEESTSGRTDTMIVATVNPETESTKMVSIPRDTYTEIIGRGEQDKITHAYAFGGPDMAMDTAENFLNVPIDYYATINFKGFEDIVNAVGGVTVENDFAFSVHEHDFPEGEIELNGEEALTYVRMRKEDPSGDLGRNERQRQVLEAVANKGQSVTSITRIGDYLDVVEENVRTNMTFDDMKDLRSNYYGARDDIENINFENGQDRTIDGVYYMEQDPAEVDEISNELRDHLELEDGEEAPAE